MSWSGAIDRGDLDEALRWVDRLAERGDWEDLDALRQRCRLAHERGHQLWPAASYAAHRLALHGPMALAVEVATTDTSAFTVGPLWEVVAARARWADIEPHAGRGPLASLMAQERVLRGEHLDEARSTLEEVEVPLHLAAIEPDYGLATYTPSEVVVDGPEPPELGPPHRLVGSGHPIPDQAAEAWRLVVEPWCSQSGGSLRSVAVRGGASEAMVELVGAGLVQTGPSDLTTALDLLQWAAASGGAHGRRRGGAVGRALAWWLVATLAGVTDDWPISAAELTDWGSELEWWVWHPVEAPDTGWQLRLAAADPTEGKAWAVAAVDRDDRRREPSRPG